ncbi:conserved exported hypothetical protein [Flavobacterium sp. 9AF]|uniref:acyl-CoA thioester hydrolase/BAAT C-terminal domain-containing protein n=1 Tax=Flavobacterium sp. 9AF TaxID=2653142 RepID=UPI0012F084BC|nr:acyl-CoA thioester hydrolase/BAAT C-terminal domain-containing protein [Flavobacterium sp. 9AF]VXB46667.1 conserved exported hypothetical protein [Flavobacterium sp. 9AF]
MKFRSLLFFLFVFKSFAQADALKAIGFEKMELRLKSDTIVFIKSINKENKPKPVILFLQGSLPLPIVFKDEEGIFVSLPFKTTDYLSKYNLIFISRKGIPFIGDFQEHSRGYKDNNGHIPIEYIKNNNLTYRSNQANEVINFLYKQKWVDKKSIYLVGHSEGYRVAANVANKNKKIAKLVCLSADPFNRTAEEILKMRIESFEINNDSLSQHTIENLITDYLNINNIAEYKKDFELYIWASYDEKLVYEIFKEIKIPILVAYGTNDLVAVHNDLLPFIFKGKKDFFVRAYPDYDHNFFKNEYDKEGVFLEKSYNWDLVFSDVVKWLEKIERK